jgi:NADH-quinone oxidoreductase subunit H
LLPFDLSDTFLGGFFGNVINVAVFIFKGWTLVFVMMWVRWTLPRLRIDQVMMTCLKYLLPISCVLLLGVGLWRVAVPEVIQAYFKYALALVCLVLLGLMVKQLMTWFSAPPGTAMPGMWRTAGTVGYQGAKQP